MGFTMMFRRCIGALLAVAAFLALLGSTRLSAQTPRRDTVAPGATYYYPGPYGGPIYPYYFPYVAPYPFYSILPPPLAAMRAAGYDMHGIQPESPARKRTTSDVVPYEKTPAERLSDLRRVRFEISVPTADAIVLLDGKKTKQTGLKRVFVTPPMEEDRLYSSTIEVQFTDASGTTRTRTKTFDFVAGETVRHQFIE